VCTILLLFFIKSHANEITPALGARRESDSLDLGANKKQMQSFVRARDPSFLLPAVHIEVLLTADLLMEFYELHYIITLSC
jgi:hypothetical protein